ncbi:MAG: NAD(P)/FAD-dependent oxidoreductase [Nitrososphaerales archaeon]
MILGAGIIGLSIAYYLSTRNFSNVLVLEKEKELTAHASGHNAGGIAYVHETEPILWPLTRETHKLYRELVEIQHFDFDFERNGTISLDPSLDERTVMGIARRFREGYGESIEFLDESDLRKREQNLSTKYCGYDLFYPNDAQGNSQKLGQCFAQASSRHGIEIRTDTEVTSFEIDWKRIARVKTSRGAFVHETVVIAAGPWSGIITEKLGFKIPVRPIKGHLISTEPSTRLIHWFIDGPHFYVVQNGMGNLVVGGGEDDTGFDVHLDELRLEETWEEGTAMIPKLMSLKQEAKIACLRPYAPEGIPIIGKSTRFENVFFATGHHRQGFCLAPVMGKIISGLIVDGETKLNISPFSPDRFL